MNLSKTAFEPRKRISNILFSTYRILLYQDKNGPEIANYLSQFSFSVELVNKTNMLLRASDVSFIKSYDIIITDYNEKPGDISILEKIRNISPDIPLILLASEIADDPAMNTNITISAFRAGADEVILKPFNIEVFIYRLRSIIRRCRPVLSKLELEYEIGESHYNTVSGIITYANGTSHLFTKSECIVFNILCAYVNKPVSKDMIASELWGMSTRLIESDTSNTRASNFFNRTRVIDVYLTNIRKALSPDPCLELKSQRIGSITLIDSSRLQ